MYQGVIFMFCIGLRTVFYKKKPESFIPLINLYLSENLVIWCDIYKKKRYFNLSLFNLQPPRSVIRSTFASTFNIKTSIFRNKDYVWKLIWKFKINSWETKTWYQEVFYPTVLWADRSRFYFGFFEKLSSLNQCKT